MKQKLGLLFVLVSYGLLYPGLTEPLLSITGYVEKAELVELGKELIQANPETPQMVNSPVEILVGNMQVEGTVRAYEKTRSIPGTITDLKQSGHWPVAFLVMFFSIIVPAIKGLVLIIGSVTKKLPTKYSLNVFAQWISKWAMADVYVVGVFVSFLAANAVKNEAGLLSFESELGLGFYCFLGYCLMSILSSQLLKASLKAPMNKEA